MTARPVYEFVTTAMSTTVSVQIVGDHPNAAELAAEALDWFRLVEAACSRFDPASELQRLCHGAPGTVQVSPLLFEVLRVALAVAEASDGAYDPTLGRALHERGFDTHWATGARAPMPRKARNHVWRSVRLHDDERTVEFAHPTLLDLGGIAKGFALDLAGRALAAVADCCVVAGGDLLCRGTNAKGDAWRTGITDPRVPGCAASVAEVHAPEYAICTSGDYARTTMAGHHLLDPRTPAVEPAALARSVTVIAPQAAVADGLATAAFVLGHDAGAALLHAQQADGLFIDATGTHHAVFGWGRTTFTRVAP